MSWFEQGTSSARCIITQLHRPAELKLKRMYTRHLAPVCSPDIRELLLYYSKKGGASNGTQFMQQDFFKTMGTQHLRAPAPVADFLLLPAIVFGGS